MLLLSIIVAVIAATSASKVYVKHIPGVPQPFPGIPCIDNPANVACPVDHKIPDLSVYGKEAAMLVGNKTFIEGIFKTLSNLTITESCQTAVKRFYCSWLFPECDATSDYLTIYDEKTKQACKDSNAKCNGSGLQSEAVDCESQKISKLPRRMICVDFPKIENDPYPCENVNYKVPDFMAHPNQTKGLAEGHRELQKEASKLDEQCLEDVASTMCSILAPACKKDRMYILDVISKQECHKRTVCLNGKASASFLGNATEWCNSLADESAQSFEASDVVDYSDDVSKAASLESKVFLFAFLAFISIFV